MVIITRFTLDWKTSGKFFSVISQESVPCPCCVGELRCIGSRLRGCLDAFGTRAILSIRRLRCLTCRKIHHELPDRLVPYKRYEAEVFETAHAGGPEAVPGVDLLTVCRWRQWHAWFLQYGNQCMKAVSHRFGLTESLSFEEQHVPGWLAKVVRMVANTNLWVHTRSVWMSED